MRYPVLPLFAFLTAFLVVIPAPWHWRARNIATLAMMGWLFIVNMIYGINSLVWAGNVDNPAPVWCDISAKLVVGASFAMPLATICICKHLEMVSSTRAVRMDVADKRRRMVFESVMCFLFPLIFMALHYVVQGHRYDIIENIGCQAALYISLPAVFLFYFPPLLFSLITFGYAAGALHHFVVRRLTFAAHLQNASNSLTTSRYLRLIAMALVEMIWGVTLTSLNLANNVAGGLRPYTSWASVHADFGNVPRYPALILPKGYMDRVILIWFTMPVTGLVFFAFFGFGEEAKKEYRKVWAWVRTRVLRRKGDVGKSGEGFSRVRAPRTLHLSSIGTIDIGGKKFDESVSSPATTISLTPITPTKFGPERSPSLHKDPCMFDEDVESQSFRSTLSYYAREEDDGDIDSMHVAPSSLDSTEPTPRPFSYPMQAIPAHPIRTPQPFSFTRQPGVPQSQPPSYNNGVQVTIHHQTSVDRIV
ncbi:STE3-domain-containing protein [Armillaria gallica]|uniref:STE3-domain-containing protein n=1 Tax=Armillaria gallica TaxID=47427 RepID=A0A2H3DA37_ARMGA|nr:STE3-domain-containing protein [Armillaria gallica]